MEDIEDDRDRVEGGEEGADEAEEEEEDDDNGVTD